MARARNIKPGFFTNEDLVELDFATRLLFAGLWTLADREGRLEDRPKKIKIGVFPADNVDVEVMLQELHRCQFIKRYEVDGERFIQIVSWHKHQSPHHTEKKSEIPDEHGCLTVKEPKQDGGNPPDSLIPDSLIPDSTTPPTPRKRGKSNSAPSLGVDALVELGVTPTVATDYIALRAKKRATVTQTVIDGVLREAKTIGMSLDEALRKCVERGWQGFEAKWLQNQARASPAHQTNSQRIADWNAELRDVLNEGQRPMVIDMGVIDASR